MPPSPLPKSVLIALGLGATQLAGCTIFGPCLSIAIEETNDTDTQTDTDTGPCLSPPEDTDTGPCLDIAEDTDTAADTSPPASPSQLNTGGQHLAPVSTGSRDDARTKVLKSGVLPADLAAKLGKKDD